MDQLRIFGFDWIFSIICPSVLAYQGPVLHRLTAPDSRDGTQMLYVQFIHPLPIKHTQVSRETNLSPSETITTQPPDQYHRLLVGQFVTSRNPTIPIKVLENEVFQVTAVKDASEFIIELQPKHYSTVWVLSSVRSVINHSFQHWSISVALMSDLLACHRDRNAVRRRDNMWSPILYANYWNGQVYHSNRNRWKSLHCRLWPACWIYRRTVMSRLWLH